MQKHVIKIGLMVILATFIFISAGIQPLLVASFTADLVEAAKGPPMKGADTARMVLVLDASGSMWGQIDGRDRIISPITYPLRAQTSVRAVM